jgi:hypothetical protein
MREKERERETEREAIISVAALPYKKYQSISIRLI